MIINKIENISNPEFLPLTKPCKDCHNEVVTQNASIPAIEIQNDVTSVYQGDVRPSGNLWHSECINCTKYAGWLEKNHSTKINNPESLNYIASREISRYISTEHILPERIKELLLDAAKIYIKSPQEAEEYLRQEIRAIVRYISQGSNATNDVKKMIDSVYTKQSAEEALTVAKSAIEKLSGSYYFDNTESTNKLLNIFNFLTDIIATQQKELLENDKVNI